MASLNKIQLIGYLGKQPELKNINGSQLSTLNLGVTDVYTDKTGQRQQNTTWFNVSVWGKSAEFCGQYLNKGNQVYVEGSMTCREYTDKDGVRKQAWDVRAERVLSLERRGDGQQNQQNQQQNNNRGRGGYPPQMGEMPF